MRRLLSLIASLLMVAGIALLVFVAVGYVRGQNTAASPPGWNQTQQQKGHEIASRLATPQKVSIPKSLRHTKLPVAGSEPGTRLVIPKISLDAPIVQTAPQNGVWDVADWAVGHLTTTANPGAPGNMALSAHDDIKGEIFKRLGELGPGDTIRIYTPHAVYIYVVTAQQTVDPSDVAVLNPTKAATVTLISCSPYWVDTQRLIVTGILKSQTAV